MATDRMMSAIKEFVDDGVLIRRAFGIAFQSQHPIYDCLYLALALDRGERLATADRRLASIARSLSIETQLIAPSL